MIQNKTEIKNGLEQNFKAFEDFISPLHQKKFEDTPEGKWSAGQQLEHLIKSAKPLNMALALPKFLYPMIWGKMNRPPRTFEELKLKYTEKLAKGGTASSPFVPPFVAFKKKTSKLKQFNRQLEKLVSRLNTLSDKQLDSLILPHPLLGKISLREMMFFTIFHTEHHLNILKTRT